MRFFKRLRIYHSVGSRDNGGRVMIKKDKVGRVVIYDSQDRMLLATKSVFFPKDFFRIKGRDLVMIKGTGLPLIPKDEYIPAVFEYINGVRMKYKTSVDLSTEYQMNFHVGDGIALEERRASFKINTEFETTSPFYIRNEEIINFDKPLNIHVCNINLGGVYMKTDFDFEPGDQFMLELFGGDMELLTEVLRIQNVMGTDVVDGYGCHFLNISQSQEERLARFIFECQITEREKLKQRQNKDF